MSAPARPEAPPPRNASAAPVGSRDGGRNNHQDGISVGAEGIGPDQVIASSDDSLAVASFVVARGRRPIPLDHPSHPRCIGSHPPGYDRRKCEGKRGKHPIGKWGTIAASEPTDKFLAYTFGQRAVNVGIACGPSGLFVVDEDRDEALSKLAAHLGETLPRTYRVRTSRGWHYYFRAPEGVELGNSVRGTLLEEYGCDVRGGKGEGGFVVAVGSVHESGHVYTAEDPDAAVADTPGWLVGLLVDDQGDGEEWAAGSSSPRPKSRAGSRWNDDPRPGMAEEFRAQYRRHLAELRGKRGQSWREALYLAALDGWRLVNLELLDQATLRADLNGCARASWGADLDARDLAIVKDEARPAALASPWVLTGGEKLRPTGTGEAGMETGAERLRNGVFTPIVITGGANEQGYDEPDGQGDEPTCGALNLPAEFWEARPALRHIRKAALSRWACPDATLGAVLARQSAYLHPRTVMDIGLGPAPVTLFSLLYGRSSAGKGISARVASELLPVPTHLAGEFRERPLGSGEGITDSYLGTVTETGDDGKPVKVRKQVRTNVLFVVDEGEVLVKLAGRKGATVTTTIRRAWSGEVLGEANASAERDRQLDRGTYAIGMCVSFQPATIGPLFDDNEMGGGTPHRFTFWAADDDTLPEEPPDDLPEWPGALDVPAPHDPELRRQWSPGSPVTLRLVDEEALREVRRTRWAGLRRDPSVGPLDGHLNQMRGRIAAHLAMLEGRTEIDGEDWYLAGMVIDRSNRVRDTAIAHGAATETEKARRADDRHIRREEAVERTRLAVAEDVETARIARGAAVLARKVRRGESEAAKNGAPFDGLTTGKLRESAGRYKSDVAACIAHAVDVGWLVAEEFERGSQSGTRYRVGPAIGEVPE